MADLTCSLNRTDSWTAPAVRPHSRAAWLWPDLALTVSLVTLFVCLVLFDGTLTLFRDSDSGWHIRTGEAILDTAHLPRHDSYSFTRTGQPWFAWEWGADVLMGAAHRAGGLAGVAGLYAFAIAASTWMWFRFHWLAGGNFLIAGVMSTLLLSTGYLHWLARPHVFSWLLLVGFVSYLDRGPERLWVVAVISALWANVHGSFFLAPVTALLYALSHFLRPLIWMLDRQEEWNRARWYALAALVAAIATMANPYGAGLHVHVFRYLSNSELISRIGEFQSFNFHSEGAAQILLMIGIAATGAVLALRQQKLAHFFVASMWIVLSLRSARALPLLALLALPIANGAISDALAEARGLRPAFRRRIDGFLEYSANLRRIDMSLGGWALVPIFVICVAAIMSAPLVRGRAGFPPQQFPVEASHQVDKLPANARILAPDMYGGYIIYRFNGARKVFFDGRSDFYGSDYMNDYLRLVELRSGWQRQVAAFGFTHALLPNRYSLVPALEQLGWKRLYSDEVATLLEKP